MESPLEALIHKINTERKAAGIQRVLRLHEGSDFASNDYLGLAKKGTPISEERASGGSRLITGNSALAERTEAQIANYFRAESALLFQSGYAANLGVISALAHRDLTILYDEFCHASIRDGIRLGVAKNWGFAHNDMQDLEKKLERTTGNVLIITESVFSMDGDEAPLVELLRLKKQFSAALLLDEAHAAGWKKDGLALAEELAIAEEIDLRIITFGKAFGAHGAAVLCSDVYKQYFINHARSFIYTTAPSTSFWEHISWSLDMVGSAKEAREDLEANILLFASLAEESPLNFLKSSSPIQGVLGSAEQLQLWSEKAGEAGMVVRPILHPTVPLGAERLRICLHSFNQKSDIQQLITLLHEHQL